MLLVVLELDKLVLLSEFSVASAFVEIDSSSTGFDIVDQT